MISDDEVFAYHATRADFCQQILTNLRFCLEKVVRDAGKDVARILGRSQLRQRVKSRESLLRKVRRDSIDDPAKLPLAVEDLLGIRIVTPDKAQARHLFEWFQHMQASWFYPVLAAPAFVPYTFENTNKYSLKSGYQAFHVTFVADHKFAWFPQQHWPCEIQIMAQVWEFWADYSRIYFYADPTSTNPALLPYSAAISKLLDAADDLMSETAKILLAPAPTAPEPAPATGGIASTPDSKLPPTSDDVRSWLADNLRPFFGDKAKIPNDFFVHKIADELTFASTSLEQLGALLGDDALRAQYKALLQQNDLAYLPVYQQILCMLLLARGTTREVLVDRLNSELRLLGIRLQVPGTEQGHAEHRA